MRPTALTRRQILGCALAGTLLLGACSNDDGRGEPTTTTTPETTLTDTTSAGQTLAVGFTAWFNRVTAGDAAAPVCGAAPAWLAPTELDGSGPLLACVETGPDDSLRLRLVNNSSSPVKIGFDDNAAGWQADTTDSSIAAGLPGGSGVVIRPLRTATLAVAAGSWTRQALAVDYPDRWSVVEATDLIIDLLGVEADDTFALAIQIAELCDVEAVAAKATGDVLSEAVDRYLQCAVDELGAAADADDRTDLAEVSKLVTDLVERSRNLRSQQQAAVLRTSLIFASGPDPAGPQITEAPAAFDAAPETVKPTVTQTTTPKPTTSPAPTSTPGTATSSTAPATAPTTGVITVPLPPAPTLVALEVLPEGADTYTGWPAVAPALARLTGGSIVVIECRAFTQSDVASGNGWWYRIGSGPTADGWASATQFDNLVPGISGPTDPLNLSDTLSIC